MLAITETLATKEGLDWAFCDTDSMALAKPDHMDEREFREATSTVLEWFAPLNPYEQKGSLLRIEDANHSVQDGAPGDQPEPLFCLAIPRSVTRCSTLMRTKAQSFVKRQRTGSVICVRRIRMTTPQVGFPHPKSRCQPSVLIAGNTIFGTGSPKPYLAVTPTK